MDDPLPDKVVCPSVVSYYNLAMTQHLIDRARIGATSILLLLLSLSFFACQQASQPEDTTRETISGVLQDEQGHALPEALIEAINAQSVVLASDTADEDGKFNFDLPVDVAGLKLRISRGDLKPFVADLLNLIQTAGGRVGLILNGDHDDSCCGNIGLTITGLNEEINHAEVKLRQGGHLVSKAYTNDHGKLTFEHVCAGEYDIRIAKDGFKVKEFELTVGEECDSVGFAVELESNGTVENDSCCESTYDFVIKNASNVALDGVQIKLHKANSDYIVKYTTNGGAHFGELCEGIYSVRVAKDGYAVQEFSIEVGCNTEGEITKTLQASGGGGQDSCCNGLIRILAKNSNGQIIEGAKVRLWKGGAQIKQETMHDGVTWSGLCEGNYSISIIAEGYVGQEFNFELGCNDTLETFTKILTANHSNSDSCCNGVFWLILNKDSSDVKIGSATVKIWKSGQIYKTGTTNADGMVKFEGMCPGTYGVSMLREGYTAKEFDGLVFECNDSIELHKSLVANTGQDCCTGILKLRVKDSTNMVYLQGASVKIYKGGQLLETVESGAEGWAVVDGLCAGNTYSVVVSKDGFHSKEMHFTYNECKTIQETVWLIAE